MFIYIAAQVSITFYCSFTLLRRGPPSSSFNFAFICSVFSFDWTLWLFFSWKTCKKNKKNSQCTSPQFNTVIGIKTKVLIKLFSATDYLHYWQIKKILFCFRDKVFLTQSFAFFQQRPKGKSLKEVAFLIEKINESKMGNSDSRRYNVCFILEWRNEKNFQSVKTTYIRQF